MCKERLSTIYCGIKQRCEYKGHNRYKNYGGRGILCLWESKEDFINDMGNGYKEGLTIGRIDNNGNYCKENCEWQTQKKQQNTRGNNIYITYKDRTMSIVEWSEELGYKRGILQSRYRKGWTPEKIIETKRFSKTVRNKLTEEHKKRIALSMIGKNTKKINNL